MPIRLSERQIEYNATRKAKSGAEMDAWAVAHHYRWIEPYVSRTTPRRGICPFGHAVMPTWNNLRAGQGGCKLCRPGGC